MISPAQVFPCQGLVKAYLASHCPFQGEGKTRTGLLISVATIGSRRQYFFSNFQRQLFFLKKAFLNIVSEYCCCLLASLEVHPLPILWLSVLSTQHSLLEKHREAEQRVLPPRLCISCKESTVKCWWKQKLLWEGRSVLSPIRKDWASRVWQSKKKIRIIQVRQSCWQLFSPYFWWLSAIVIPGTKSKACLSCCAKLFLLSASLINQEHQQTPRQVAKKHHPVFKMHQLPAEITHVPF